MPSTAMRGFLGFTAGVIAVLIFHQGMVEALHAAGLVPFAPYRTTPVPPLGVPAIVSHCFWGGLWGALFGLLMTRFIWPIWLCGPILGVAATLTAWFIVAPLKAQPLAHGWVVAAMLRSFLINGSFGVGVGLILPMLMPRPLARAHPMTPG